MASSDTDQKSFKDLTEEVVNNELNEITAFQIVLKSFVESNPLTEKVSVQEVFDSTSELLSFVSVLRKHLESFTKQYGVHLVGYGCMEKMETSYAECSSFHKLLSLQKELDMGVRPPSPIHASSVADFVVEKEPSVKCSLCREHCNPASPKDRKSQFTCKSVDVNKCYRPKKK